jgi:hypothetical protein
MILMNVALFLIVVTFQKMSREDRDASPRQQVPRECWILSKEALYLEGFRWIPASAIRVHCYANCWLN